MWPTNRTVNSLCRRDLLRSALGTAGVVALAGCSAAGGPRYSLRSRPENGTSLVDLFTWEPASNAFHYDEAYVATLADELRETGSVVSVEIPLVEERPSGEDGFLPAYTHHDGTYFRVHVNGESVTLDRWTVWMEPLDEIPDGVEYTTEPRAGLSKQDANIVDRAISQAIHSVVADEDHAAKRAYRRGVVFFEPLDPDESELVPEPPFEYALVEPQGHGAPDELALRFHVGIEPVETTRYTHTIEQIADQRGDFVAHLREEHVAGHFSRDEDSKEVQDILAEATELGGYVEEGALSEAFESVLAEIDLADVTLPDASESATWRRYYEYDGAYYWTRLRISDRSPT